MDPELREPLLARNLADTVNAKSQRLQEATKSLSGISDVYRSTVKSIDDKIILLAAGSISLLLTFIGILFNSSKDVTSLHYPLIIVAIAAWLMSILLLLLSRWYQVLHLFSTAHGHRLSAWEQKIQAETAFYESYPDVVSSDTFEDFTDRDFKKMIKASKDSHKLIKEAIARSKKKKSLHDKLYRASRLASYVLFILGYTLALIFFLGVFDIMKG